MGGEPFMDDPPRGSTPGGIEISADKPGFIRMVQFQYVTEDDAVIEESYHGVPSGDSGTSFGISLGKKAYITRISGQYGQYVDSLKVTTVRDEGGTEPRVETLKFGGPGGPAFFIYQAPAGYEIVGFFGRAHDVVDAIGVLYSPLTNRGANTTFNPAMAQGVGGGFDDFDFGQPEPTEDAGPSPAEPMERSGGPITPR
jgi:hypothetical protein